jgi:hypothetical protein
VVAAGAAVVAAGAAVVAAGAAVVAAGAAVVATGAAVVAAGAAEEQAARTIAASISALIKIFFISQSSLNKLVDLTGSSIMNRKIFPNFGFGNGLRPLPNPKLGRFFAQSVRAV